MEDNKKIKKLIHQTIEDTHYILNTHHPLEGVYTVLFHWLVLYVFASVTLAVLDRFLPSFLLNQYNDLEALGLFFSIKRVSILVLFSLILIGYGLKNVRTNMSLKERDFLKLFSVFVFLYSLSRMIYPIAYYLNHNILLSFNNTLPLDHVVNIFASLYLYSYCKKRPILFVFFYNCIYVAFNFVLNIINPSTNTFFGFINHSLSYFNSSGAALVFSFILLLFVLKSLQGDVYEN